MRTASGQALVEAAIVLPLCVGVLLSLLQLAMLQQARTLAEYAAYQAARAGIVHGGDPVRMESAATWVLAPTVCPTRLPLAGAVCGAGAGASTQARQLARVAVLDAVSASARAAGSQFPGLRVDILSPYWPAHARHFRTGGGEQMDFDDLAGDASYREATLLTVRLLYWYELKIPLADFIVWSAWAAARVGKQLGGALDSPEIVARSGLGRAPTVLTHGRRDALLALLGLQVSNPLRASEIHRGSYDPVRTEDLQSMVDMAATGRFFLPLIAHQTLRMQSAFEARHVRGCSCSQGCPATCRAW